MAVKRKPIYVLILPRFQDIFHSFYTGEITKGVNLAASRLNVDFLVHITDQAAGRGRHGATADGAGHGGQQPAGGNDRAHTGDGEQAQAGGEADATAHDGAERHAGFGPGLGVVTFVRGDVVVAFEVVGEQADLALTDAGGAEFEGGGVAVFVRVEEAGEGFGHFGAPDE